MNYILIIYLVKAQGIVFHHIDGFDNKEQCMEAVTVIREVVKGNTQREEYKCIFGGTKK